MKILLFFGVLLVLQCSDSVIDGAKLSQKFHRCKVSPSTDYKTNHCMEEAVQHAISYLSESGDSDLDLPDLDPLEVKEIAIRQGNKNAPVSIELLFRNLDVTGLSQYKLKSFKGKVSSPKDFKFTINGNIDSLMLVGNYKMAGNILILPVTGNGPCNISLEGLRTGATFIGEPMSRNGKEYLKIKNFKISVDLDKAHMHFANLLGDKALTDGMNRFMNENWIAIFAELKPFIEEAISQLFEIYTRRIFERVQFKNIFLLE